jgi:hypothetical protein
MARLTNTPDTAPIGTALLAGKAAEPGTKGLWLSWHEEPISKKDNPSIHHP